MKKRPQPILRCPNCGHEPEGKREGNWTVYKTKCEKCGCVLEMMFPEDAGAQT